MLDTNALSDLIRDPQGAVFERMTVLPLDEPADRVSARRPVSGCR